MDTKFKQVNSLLVIQLAGLGDMVMATPALEALRRLYPQSRIYLLTNSRCVDIMRGSPYIDGIFVLKGINDAFVTIKKLRSFHFDMVINLYRLYSSKGAIKMYMLFLAIGGKLRVGRDTEQRGFFYHLKVPERLSDRKHEVEYKLDIIRALGGDVDDISFKVEYDNYDEEFVNTLFDKNGVTVDDSLIGINCSTFRASRNWTVKNYAELADSIIKRLGVKVAFLGINKDKNLFLKIKRFMKAEPLDFVGALNTRQLGVLLRRCKLFVSCDSGPVHIASALKVPMVVLFGPGEYERYKPYGNNDKTIVIRKQVDCAPCFKNVCRNNKCMKLIAPEEVFQAVEQLLRGLNV